MEQTEFSISVRPGPEYSVLELHGLIDSTAEAALAASYEEASAAGTIVLDFEGISYINSTGIALIVGILAKARKSGATIRAFGLSDHYREIFEITRLADFMAIYDDETAATATG